MKDKIAAALLAFFLGAIGVHRFYLDQTGLGFVYLIFCWTFIPAIISFIDFIIFLTMSKENFDLKYNRAYFPNQVINNYATKKLYRYVGSVNTGKKTLVLLQKIGEYTLVL